IIATLSGDHTSSITAETGAIHDDGNAATSINSDYLFLTATLDIGSEATPLKINVDHLDASSSASGSIYINEVDQIRVDRLSTADGAIYLTADSHITANGIHSGDLGNDDQHNITLNSDHGNLNI